MATTPEAYVHYSKGQKTLTFYYDTLRADRNITTCGIRDWDDYFSCPVWAGDCNSPCTTAVFDASFRDFRPTTTARWFCELNLLERIEGLEHLNTSQVTSMGWMFKGCGSLTSLDLSRFDTSKVTSMSGLFWGCRSLTSLDLSRFDTSKVTSMSGLFSGCGSLTSLDLTCFDTSKVTDMRGMFEGCGSLTSLDLSSFDTSNVTDMRGMFYSCESLTTIYCNSSWSDRLSDDMFSGCNSLRGAATNVGNSYDVSMANPETGYFTKKVLS